MLLDYVIWSLSLWKVNFLFISSSLQMEGNTVTLILLCHSDHLVAQSTGSIHWPHSSSGTRLQHRIELIGPAETSGKITMPSLIVYPTVALYETPNHELHETCHSVTFIVLVNSHQRWKQTRNRVCFHLWCELTLALWCHSIVWSLFSWNKM